MIATNPKAPNGRRLVAALIDGVVGAAPALLIPLAFLLARDADAPFGFGPVPLAILAATLVAAAWGAAYFLAKDGFGGRGLGKRAAGLIVVQRETNAPCTLWPAVLRQLVWAGLGAVPLVGWLVEPIAVLAREDGRRVGDLAAGTQVVTVEAHEAERARREAMLLHAPPVGVDAVHLRQAMREVDDLTRHAD